MTQQIDPAQFAIQTLQAIDAGAFLAALGASLHRADEANRAMQQKATVTIALTIESVKELGESAVTITGRVTEKLPARPPRPQFLFRTTAGGFSTRDPRQLDMFDGPHPLPDGATIEEPQASTSEREIAHG